MGVRKFKLPSDFKIPLIYVVLGALWILYSDKAMRILVTDADLIKKVEVFKGWFYVFITGILLFLLIRKELTKRNQILRELEKAKLKAEESDKLKSAFLSNMSHYLRTPLNSILGFVDLLKNRNLDDEKREKFLSIVNEQSSHLLQFIGNIIEISKLQEGQTQLNISNFSLNELMKKVQKRYQTELEYLKKNRLVKLSGKFPEHDVWMSTDPEKLEYILTNLLSNAIKFTGAGEIVFGYEVKQQMIEYYVIDTGMGIAAEKQELITKTFMLSDPDISDENSGIGLGLALTNGFVKLLNGRLWIEYSNPHGTKICFRIPVKIS